MHDPKFLSLGKRLQPFTFNWEGWRNQQYPSDKPFDGTNNENFPAFHLDGLGISYEGKLEPQQATIQMTAAKRRYDTVIIMPSLP